MYSAGFSIKDAIRVGWDLFKNNWKFLVVLSLLVMLIEFANGFVSMIPYVGIILSFIIGVFYSMGVIYIFLNIYDGKPTRYVQLFSRANKILPYVGIVAISLLIQVGGFVLLVVPGVIAMIALMLAPYLMVDRDLGVMESIRTSWQITKGNRLKLFVFSLLLVVINLLGAILFLVGLIVTIPVSLLAVIHVYRQLLSNAEKDGVTVEKLQTAPKVFLSLGVLIVVVFTVMFAMFIMSDEGRMMMNAMSEVENMSDEEFEAYLQDNLY